MVPVPGYFLDGASAIAAAVMDVAPGASVLDLCGARWQIRHVGLHVVLDRQHLGDMRMNGIPHEIP